MERGGSIDLPTLNYSDTIGDIYRVFTVRVSQFAHSLDSIVFAAVKSSDGQPSWVPDWSANNSHDWVETSFKTQAADEYGYHIFVSKITFLKQMLFPVVEPQAILQQPRFRFDRTEMVLTVQAHQICNIRICLPLPTNERRVPRV